MKVLMQLWQSSEGPKYSISKDQEQLDQTICDIKEKHPDAEPVDEPYNAEIPGEHVFAQMIERETIFLHDDEMGVISYPND